MTGWNALYHRLITYYVTGISNGDDVTKHSVSVAMPKGRAGDGYT